MSVVLVLICALVGLLIGAVGVGGVLLVPALSLFAGIGVHEAIPACMLSFLATGAVGVLMYARHGSIRWDLVGWLCCGAVPAALLGSITLQSIPPDAIMLLISVLMIFAGIDALRKSSSTRLAARAGRELRPRQFVLIGFVTGFGSAITGTGGPLILVPIVIYLGVPVLIAIGLSQAIQVPIAAFASAGYWLAGNLNFALALLIAAAMVGGAVAGASLAHRLPAEPLRKFIALLLLVAGAGIALRLAAGFGIF